MGSDARRIVLSADAERRRLERKLHDGAQQRVVALATTLTLAGRRVAADDEGALALVEQARTEARDCLEDLRDLAREIYPAVLAERGLASALQDLARRAPVPVEVIAAPDRRLPEPVELTAYLVASTALAEAAGDEEIRVSASVEQGELALELHHASLTGAELERLGDRVRALGGALASGPSVRATLPLDPE